MDNCIKLLPDPPPTEPWTLTARWVFPVDQPPLARGTVTIGGDRICAVDKAGTRRPDLDMGNVAILPGFVNAHTHLDLSDALGKCPPKPDFTQWLRMVIQHRRQQTPEDVAQAIDMGLSQCLKYGTTLVGDISAGGTSWKHLVKAPMRAVVFYELLGLSEERAKQSFSEAREWMVNNPPTETCGNGLSPHAPYSVRASLFEEAVTFASDARLSWDKMRTVPMAIHLAETVAELLLLEEKTGPFVKFLSELGVWDPSGLARNLEYILGFFKHVGFPPRSLFIHCNYLNSAERLPGFVGYCPRTHAAFGHPPHPFRKFLANGTPVALGTDSLASNPDLDLLAEARFIHGRHPDFPQAILLRMATLSGATALGFDHSTGSLSSGKSADLVVLPLPNDYAAEPHDLIFKSNLPVQSVMFRGQWVIKDGEIIKMVGEQP